MAILIFGAVIWFLSNQGKYEGETAEYWYNAYDESESRIQDYKDALEQANTNIDDAKYSAWESYEEMGDALDGLETVNEP